MSTPIPNLKVTFHVGRIDQFGAAYERDIAEFKKWLEARLILPGNQRWRIEPDTIQVEAVDERT